MKAERTWLLKAERRGSEADPALTHARGSMGHALFESSGAGSLVSFGFDGLYLQTALEFRAKGGLCQRCLHSQEQKPNANRPKPGMLARGFLGCCVGEFEWRSRLPGKQHPDRRVTSAVDTEWGISARPVPKPKLSPMAFQKHRTMSVGLRLCPGSGSSPW